MGYSSLFSPSRFRENPHTGKPCIIATIPDFGDLEERANQTQPGYTQYKSTHHILNKKDFDRILDFTAIRIQSQKGQPLLMEREFRVRIWVPGGSWRYLHISSFNIVDVENMVVRFDWKAIWNGGS